MVGPNPEVHIVRNKVKGQISKLVLRVRIKG